jgi:hypothetical protein
MFRGARRIENFHTVEEQSHKEGVDSALTDRNVNMISAYNIYYRL